MELGQLDSDVQKLRESLGELPEPVVKPFLILIGGLPGTGKSYFSNKLAERLPALVVESDAMRKVLFASPAYSLEESSRLFQVVHFLIEGLLGKGVSIIMDATNLTEGHREYIYRIADRLKVRLIAVWVEAPAEVVRERLETRAASKSDADWAVYKKMKPLAEKIKRNHYVVDTSKDITPVIDKIVTALSR